MNQWRTFQFFEKQLIKEEGTTEPNQELKVIFYSLIIQFNSTFIEFSIYFFQVIIFTLVNNQNNIPKIEFIVLLCYINYFIQ
jgi:hypothetical protein